jgi:hypothetical protein
MKRLVLILSVSMAFSVTPSYGAWMSGTELLGFCLPVIGYEDRALSGDENLKAGLCVGYIHGWLDSNQYYRKFPPHGTDFPSNVCIPEGLEIGPITEIVIKYLQENPNQRDLGASNLVHSALQDFACTVPE